MATASGRERQLTPEDIRRSLFPTDAKCIPTQGFTQSAVLLPLFRKDGSFHVLFTKRTERVEHHKGHISFPGGRYDREDPDLVNTALREVFEEIGVRPSDVQVLGSLDACNTASSSFTIMPFVGLIPHPYPFVVNRNEVDSLIEVPVSTLLDPGCCEERPGEFFNKPQYFYHCGEHVIWGATARILRQFLDITFAG